ATFSSGPKTPDRTGSDGSSMRGATRSNCGSRPSLSPRHRIAATQPPDRTTGGIGAAGGTQRALRPAGGRLRPAVGEDGADPRVPALPAGGGVRRAAGGRERALRGRGHGRGDVASGTPLSPVALHRGGSFRGDAGGLPPAGRSGRLRVAMRIPCRLRGI